MLVQENRHENPAISGNDPRTGSRPGDRRSLRGLRWRDVLGRRRSRTARFAVVGAVLMLAAASAALADSGTGQQGPLPDATAQQPDARLNQALLGVYSLDSQLQAWRARLASLRTAAIELRHRRAALRQELGAARLTLHISQGRLAVNLRSLYERGSIDPVAVLLGASSLANGLQRLDDLKRVADQSRQMAVVTTEAQRSLLHSRLRLTVEARRLAYSLAAARQAEQRLAAAATARLAYVSALRAKERLQTTQVQSVLATAQAAEQKSQQLQPTTTIPPPASGGRTLVVSATCYDLPGKTATGMPVGPGVVAVDPTVIPLGSKMYVPGYGNGVAADVGGGIQGATIDLWMTQAQCFVWGRRTVTITVY
jgi:3D (Asp-Asp-Asp) domain-containing protein